MLSVRELVKVYPGPVAAFKASIWTCPTACSDC